MLMCNEREKLIHEPFDKGCKLLSIKIFFKEKAMLLISLKKLITC